MGLKGVALVKSFADWLTNRRRLVVWKRFVALEHPHLKAKAIPQPSETRWLFYSDVVSAVMSQRQLVECFVKTQHDFAAF